MALSDQTRRFEDTLQQLFRAELARNEDGLEVKFGRANPVVSYKLADSDLTSLQTALTGKQVAEDTILYDSNSLEMPIAFEGYGPARFRDGDSVTKEDPDNGIKYSLGKPTSAYLLYFFNLLQERSRTSRESRRLIHRRMIGSGMRREAAPTLFDHLAGRFFHFRTIQITCQAAKSLSDLLGLLSAFIFQYSYNTGIPIIEIRFLEQFLRAARMQVLRRSSFEEMEPPRRLYVTDLVYHYQMGLASDSPPLQYLSFYHVAEHFFEAVYTEDMIQSIIGVLTGPGFSYRRRSDITALIRTVRSKIRTVNERDVFNEEDALRLVLKNYIDPARLRASLDEYDSSLLEFYKNTPVSFAETGTVDLSEADLDRLTKRLASRIYKTRNAIVHSKDGGRGRYIPFQHDRDLFREVPLLRFIAEEILVGSSKTL
jgi:hypothetical protein